jgi:small GTP-binding protein
MATSYNLKVVLLGAGRVGKTSIISAFVYNKFDPEQQRSRHAENLKKELYSPDGSKKLCINVWDTAGQEIYHCIAPQFFKDADAVLLVYSITSLSSFSEINFWLQEVNDKGPEKCIVAIVANQVDRVEEQEVSFEQGQELAKLWSSLFFPASAKTGEGIHAVFEAIAERKYPGLLTRTAPPQPMPNPGPLPPQPALTQPLADPAKQQQTGVGISVPPPPPPRPSVRLSTRKLSKPDSSTCKC